MMSLINEWKLTLRKAWSIRFMLLAGVLTGGEAVIQIYGANWMPAWLPQWARLLVILTVIGGAFVARIVAQKSMSNDPAK